MNFVYFWYFSYFSRISRAWRYIVVRIDDMELGILADDILGMRRIPLNEIQQSLPTLTGIREKYLKGVTNERLVVLDLAKIFLDKGIMVVEEVGM